MFSRLLPGLLALAAVVRAENVPGPVVDHYLKDADQTYLAPADEAKSPWKVVITLGATVTDGNSNTTTVAFSTTAEREWEKWKLALGVFSTYGESNSVESANEHIFTERLDRKIDGESSIFQTLLAEHDEQEKLTLRLQLALGYTHRMIDKEGLDLWVDLGAGVIYEDFRPAGDDTEAIVVLTVRWKWQLTKSLLYEQTFSFEPSLSNGGEFRFISESTFSTPIHDDMSLTLVIRDVYDSEVPAGIKHNDLTIILALVINL